jgi:hypothetical protein
MMAVGLAYSTTRYSGDARALWFGQKLAFPNH